MPAANTDKFRQGTNGTRPEAAYLTAQKTNGSDNISLNTTTGWATTTAIDLIMYRKNTSNEVVAGTVTTWVGVVSGTTIVDMVLKAGTEPADGYPAGELSVVIAGPTAAMMKDLVDGLLVSHDQDGTLKAGAVDVPAVLADEVVTTAKIDDGAVTPAKLSSEAKWWEEIGRTTLASAADTITVSSFSARKYLQIKVNVFGTGGTIDAYVRFNNDSGANYSRRMLDTSAGTSNGTSETGCLLTGAATFPNFRYEGDVANVSAQEKIVNGLRTETTAAGAASAPIGVISIHKWANTSAQITRVDVVNLAGTGSFAAGSEVIILGHD
jgi:hypothetical protein